MVAGRFVATVASRKEMTVKLARAFLTLFPTILMFFFNVLVVLGLSICESGRHTAAVSTLIILRMILAFSWGTFCWSSPGLSSLLMLCLCDSQSWSTDFGNLLPSAFEVNSSSMLFTGYTIQASIFCIFSGCLAGSDLLDCQASRLLVLCHQS